MDQREFDRAVDAAAGGLIRREPSRALGYTVMARVRANAGPRPKRRVVWLSAGVGAALCAAIAMMVMTGAPPGANVLPRELHLPVAQAALAPAVPIDAPREPPRPRHVAVRAATGGVSRSMPVLPEVSTIEPIETPPIVLTTIEVPQLDREGAASIDSIRIEPITVEPLAVSND